MDTLGFGRVTFVSRAHRARRDASEPDIIATLEAAGCQVRKLAQRGVPDLLIWRTGRACVWLAECKTGGGKLRKGTQTGWSDLGLPVVVFRGHKDVLSWLARTQDMA